MSFGRWGNFNTRCDVRKALRIQDKLKRSIERLPASGSFSVIFFSAGPYALPPGALVKASKRSKEEAAKWIEVAVCTGQPQSAGGEDAKQPGGHFSLQCESI